MNYNVIIVDDDIIFHLLAKRMITMSGLHPDPLEFNNGQDALDYLLKNHRLSGKTIVLLDINMPVLNGWEFLDAIGADEVAGTLQDDLDVYMVTSSCDRADKDKATAYPMVKGFIEKPLTREVFKRLRSEYAGRVA